MPNESGRAYGLTTMFPLCNDSENDQSYAAIVRGHLRALEVDENSPMAKVPNTYLCRLFVLDNVFYEGKPAVEEHLKSKYLVFVAEIHGDLDTYLRGMWTHAEAMIRRLFHYCIAFHSVRSADDFVRYVKKCQVETTFYFNGSNDEPLAEQLKALYLKQELAWFVRDNQGKTPVELQQAFRAFVARTQPKDPSRPTWRPGASSLDVAVTP